MTIMTNAQFEQHIKESIIKAYIQVMGAEKWASATDDEKNYVLHMMVQTMGKAAGII